MDYRQFYESRYLGEALTGVFYYLNAVYVDYGLISMNKPAQTLSDKDKVNMEYYDTLQRAKAARARGEETGGSAA
eukprot:10787731-Prorocentrum_lima.AAC.1